MTDNFAVDSISALQRRALRERWYFALFAKEQNSERQKSTYAITLKCQTGTQNINVEKMNEFNYLHLIWCFMPQTLEKNA